MQTISKNRDLFEPDLPEKEESLAPGAAVLRGFASDIAATLMRAIDEVSRKAPFVKMRTPFGRPMQTGMTNCGMVGWVSDLSGYRYAPINPGTHKSWPQMPEIFATLAKDAAAQVGYRDFKPDCCLINCYSHDTKLGIHRDKDEVDLTAPIVSVSLGLEAVFIYQPEAGPDQGSARRILLQHGDVVVWGGPERLARHGIHSVIPGQHPLTGSKRFNLTFRKAL